MSLHELPATLDAQRVASSWREGFGMILGIVVQKITYICL